jgi:hypothetical protein
MILNRAQAHFVLGRLSSRVLRFHIKDPRSYTIPTQYPDAVKPQYVSIIYTIHHAVTRDALEIGIDLTQKFTQFSDDFLLQPWTQLGLVHIFCQKLRQEDDGLLGFEFGPLKSISCLIRCFFHCDLLFKKFESRIKSGPEG